MPCVDDAPYDRQTDHVLYRHTRIILKNMYEKKNYVYVYERKAIKRYINIANQR